MASPELSVNYGFAVKVETTAGTYITPTMADDALRLAEEPEVEIGYVLPGGRDGVAVAGYGVPPSAKPLGQYGRVTIATELVGSGVVDTPPRWGRLLQPFMSETVNAGTNVQYVPAASQKKSLSLLIEHANKLVKIRGAVPESIRLVGSPDEARVLVRATLAGALEASPTEGALESQTFGAQGATPTPFVGAFQLGGVVMVYEEFDLDFGIAARPWRIDRNQASGLIHGIVTQVNPRITFPPELTAIATHDPFARQTAPQTPVVYSHRLGNTATNQYIIEADHVEYDPAEAIPLRSNNGMVYYSPITLRFARPSSGVWFRVTHD